ncbi:YqgE/AlgH family protein [Enterobacteriaceae bacterium LUAb1]
MNLQHHFLIAMPGLQDPRFKRAVIYICEHSDEGAMGLIINKPIENLSLKSVLQKMNIIPCTDSNYPDNLNKPIFTGGPLAEDHGFILHSNQGTFNSSIRISDNTVITTSRDILESLGTDTQPDQVLVALGYCAWEHNQLEEELLENAWLTAPANSNILFHTPVNARWREAAKCIGIDIHKVTLDAGHA